MLTRTKSVNPAQLQGLPQNDIDIDEVIFKVNSLQANLLAKLNKYKIDSAKLPLNTACYMMAAFFFCLVHYALQIT